MVNTVAVGCESGYLSKKSDAKICTFHFPMNKPELLVQWERSVNRREWKPTENSILCNKHFDEKYIKWFSKKCHLNWKINPVPTTTTKNYCSYKHKENHQQNVSYRKMSCNHFVIKILSKMVSSARNLKMP